MDVSCKDRRKIEYDLAIFSSEKNYYAPSSDDWDSFCRLTTPWLDISGVKIYMRPIAAKALNRVSDILFDSLDIDAEYSGHDVLIATQKTISEVLSRPNQPNCESVLDYFDAVFNLDLKEHYFLCRVSGIVLEDMESVEIGDICIQKFNKQVRGVLESKFSQNSVFLKKIEERYISSWVAVSSVFGTIDASREKFYLDFDYAAAALTLFGCLMHGGNTSMFSIRLMNQPGMGAEWAGCLNYSSEDGSGAILNYLSKDSQVVFRKFDIDQAFSTYFLNEMGCIVSKRKKDEIESAILRSLYWFKQASNEVNHSVAFIKLWTCCESFFSLNSSGMTESNATGIAVLLVQGGYEIYPESDYQVLKRKIKRFYQFRSKIIHRGFIDEVSNDDRIEFAEIVAWVIIVMVSLTAKGYTKLKQVQQSYLEVEKSLTS